MSATERDHQLAAAHLLADGQTHTKAELDALAGLLATARADERVAVVAWLRARGEAVASSGRAGAGREATALSEASDLVERGDHRDNPLLASHAGECALCRAPFVRGEDGAVASCGCHESKP